MWAWLPPFPFSSIPNRKILHQKWYFLLSQVWVEGDIVGLKQIGCLCYLPIKKKKSWFGLHKNYKTLLETAKSRGFEVRSYYHSLSSPNGCRCLGICCSDWRSLLGLQVDFFSWIAALGKILSTDNLPKRGIKVLDWCCMCKRDGESLAWTKCKKFWGMWTFYHWC